MKQQGIHYKDVLAMPGSELHKYLSEGNEKKAAQSYQETEARYQKMISKPLGYDFSTGNKQWRW